MWVVVTSKMQRIERHMRLRSENKRPSAGFTMIELMMAVLIIAILAGLILTIASIAGRKTDRAKAIKDMELIKNGLEEYRLAANTYVATNCDTSDPNFQAALKPYVATNIVYTDPWGRPYHYISNSRFSYTLFSSGPDGVNNTVDDVSTSTGNM